MTHAQAKSELMQIYMSLSEEKKQAIDVVMAQADGEYQTKKSCETCKYSETFNLDCARCDDDMTNYAPKQADGDLISRQAVQNYIAHFLSLYLQDNVREAVEAIDEVIGDMPSVSIPPEHDGCKDCKHELKSDGEYPCSYCKQNFNDMWEREKPTDTITQKMD